MSYGYENDSAQPTRTVYCVSGRDTVFLCTHWKGFLRVVFNETKEAFLLFDTWSEISLQGKRASSDIHTLTQECFRIQATAAALLIHRGRNSTPTGRDLRKDLIKYYQFR